MCFQMIYSYSLYMCDPPCKSGRLLARAGRDVSLDLHHFAFSLSLQFQNVEDAA
jgi:hypothetical protein